MGDIDAKILYETIDINCIASIILSMYGPLNSSIIVYFVNMEQIQSEFEGNKSYHHLY